MKSFGATLERKIVVNAGKNPHVGPTHARRMISTGVKPKKFWNDSEEFEMNAYKAQLMMTQMRIQSAGINSAIDRTKIPSTTEDCIATEVVDFSSMSIKMKHPKRTIIAAVKGSEGSELMTILCIGL